jgi:diguanylate cyclase (GGDEF)-like protein
VIVIVTLGQAWFTYIEPDYHARLVISTLLASFLFALHALVIFRHGAFSFARVLAVSVLVFMLAMQMLRLVTSFLEPIGDSVLFVSTYHQIYVTSFAFSILLFSIAMVLLATERLREELEHLATHDSLTDAFTRRHMNEALAQELERSRRQGRDLSLLAMDLDHFKSINDTYGHQAGDRVLIEFVADVRTLLRRHDQLGRFGGEEFVVLLPETNADTALSIAERIRVMMATRKSGCTVSIGVTSRMNDSDTVDALLARADAAMYRAKSNGRNRVELN